VSNKYDLESDTPYGVASADFPVTFYDRPQLMFGNLLRGDVDGLTRAMLSPSTLTPQQMKTVRDVLMPGKKVDPILKTVTDIATNPLVIIGLVVGLWKFPLGTTAPLLALRRGLLPKAAMMGPMMDGLHDAMMNCRTIPGLFEKMLGVTRETTKFMSKYWEAVDDVFSKAGPLSRAERYQIAARLDGLDKADHYMVKLLRDEPEWIALMGGRDIPIAAGLQNTMSRNAISVSDRLRTVYNNMRKHITGNPVVNERMRRAVEKKGLKYGEDVDNYLSHAGEWDKYYNKSVKGTTGVRYRRWLERQVAEKIGGEEIARRGGLVADLSHIREMESAGSVPRGFSDMVQRIYDRWSLKESKVVETLWNDIRGLGLPEEKQRSEFVRRMFDHYKGREHGFVARLGNTRRARDTLDAMAGALQDSAFGGPEVVQKEIGEIGKVLATPGKYTLDVADSVGRYINSVASSYAWHGTGLGSEIMQIVEKPGTFRNAPHLESYVMDDLLPHIQGLKSFPQMQRSLNYAVRREKIFNWIGNHPMIDSVIGSDRKKWLLDYFGKSKALSSSDAMSASIAHHFYLSSLGLNLSSSAKNSLQPLITTINAQGIGLPGIWRGLWGYGGQEGLIVKMGRYIGHIASRMKPTDAFNAAFPEFVEDAGQASKIVDAMLAGDVAREGYARVVRKKGLDYAKRILMAPFATTEAGNRLLAYYSGRNSHLFHNAEKYIAASAEGKAAMLKEAGEVGQTLNMYANFTGGPLGLPKAIINMSPHWRQFMHFPMRFMGFLHGSLRLGADPNKLDWGTMGRALAGSTATYLAARNMLGTDLSGGLLTGALPLPTYEQSPFYPFPLVPPTAQLIGTAAKALMSGDMSGMADSAALLAPGGIAAKRAYQTLAPRYADYANPTPEGRIPLYSRNKSLIGTLSPMELSLRAIGLRPTSVSAEAGAAKWLLSQRDRIRNYRREYTEALAQNDTRKAERINAEFQRVYPELGPLQIKKSDIRAIENRKQVSRLMRIEAGLPTAYRPIFSQIIGEAGLGTMIEDIQSGGYPTLQNYLPQR
jgi:hypothetical protein